MLKRKVLERKIEVLKKKILEIGEMHPGSLSEQYNVCGTSGCKCKDKSNPVRHGPYTKLTFTFQGKGRCKFIRKECIDDFMRFTSNYRKFREHIEQLVQYNIELINLVGEKE